MNAAAGTTWKHWHASLVWFLDRERARAFPTLRVAAGSSTITGRLFHF